MAATIAHNGSINERREEIIVWLFLSGSPNLFGSSGAHSSVFDYAGACAGSAGSSCGRCFEAIALSFAIYSQILGRYDTVAVLGPSYCCLWMPRIAVVIFAAIANQAVGLVGGYR